MGQDASGRVEAERWLILGIIGYFIGFAGYLVFLVPPFEGPDEIAHLDYINFIARYGEAPNPLDRARITTTAWERHQHPLYYAVCALVPWLSKSDHTIDAHGTARRDGSPITSLRDLVPKYSRVAREVFPESADLYAFYGLRLLSVVFGAATIYLSWKMARLAIREAYWPLFPALFVATLPQFAFSNALLNNDSLANLLAAAAIYVSLRIIQDPARWQRYVTLGSLLGLGLLAKKTLLVLLPGVALVFAYVLWRVSKERGRIAVAMCGCAVLTALISGGWFLRNQRLYGELLAGGMERQIFADQVMERSLVSDFFLGSYWHEVISDVRHKERGWGSVAKCVSVGLGGLVGVVLVYGMRRRLHAWRGTVVVGLAVMMSMGAVLFRQMVMGRFAGEFISELFVSFIGNFGNLALRLPDLVYDLYGVVAGLAVVGLFCRLVEVRMGDFAIIVLGWFALLCLVGVIFHNLTFTQLQGRYLFPVLPAIAVLLGRGLSTLLGGPRYVSLKQCIMVGIVWVFLGADVVSILRMHACWYAGVPHF